MCLIWKGRQLERFDGGFKASTGYFQMESAHSHPVLVSFCAVLYYKRLASKQDELNAPDWAETARRRKGEIRVEPVLDAVTIKEEETAVSNIGQKIAKKTASKAYKRKVVNRWAVAVTLVNNLQLVPLRKSSSSFQKVRV